MGFSPCAQIHAAPQKTIEAVSEFLQLPVTKTIKTLIVLGESDGDAPAPMIALVVRGDHRLNKIKAEKLEAIAEPLQLAPEARINDELGLELGSIGPIGLCIPTIIDRSAAALKNFVCGANNSGYHLVNANWPDDITVEDIREVEAGDPSPCGQGTLSIKRGIEVGHIFQLGSKYSEAMNARIQDPNGKDSAMMMGCYGIGVSRVVAAAIEQNHDDNGIIWPDNIAPFKLTIIPVNAHKSQAVKTYCDTLYQHFSEAGIDVLYMDEEKARLGAMLADVELIGIPHRLVVGERSLQNNEVEYRSRRASDNDMLDKDTLIDTLTAKLL